MVILPSPTLRLCSCGSGACQILQKESRAEEIQPQHLVINSLENYNLHETTALLWVLSTLSCFAFQRLSRQRKYSMSFVDGTNRYLAEYTFFLTALQMPFLLNVVYREVRQQKERDVFTLVWCRFEFTGAEKLCVFLSGKEAVCLCFYD